MGIAHAGHAELRVTDLEGSRRFFTESLGLFASDESDTQVYLRAWQDFEHHTLVLTQAEESGVEHIAWRVQAPEDLATFEATLKAEGVATWWVAGGSGELGHGDALRFLSPVSGIPFELYYEVEKYHERDPAMKSRLASHPQRFTGNGIAPRRFDHFNFLVDDVAGEQEWVSRVLGIRHNYYVVGDGETRLGSWLASTNLSHEVGFMRNRAQDGNHLHHVGYYVESPDQLVRGATILMEAGYKIEWGPGAHGTSGAMFLYVFEPSGHRIEVWTGGFLLFAPDWEPIRWDPEIGGVALEMWGSPMPESYLTYGTPLTPQRVGQPTA
jgi:catechol 2,3-dioxygenase